MEHMDLDWYWSNIMPNIVDLDGNCLLHSIAMFDYQSVHGGGPHL